MTTPLDILAPAGCTCYGDANACLCTPAQKGLDQVARGNVAMTSEQREWCLSQMDDRATYDGEPDSEVAYGFLCNQVTTALTEGTKL